MGYYPSSYPDLISNRHKALEGQSSHQRSEVAGGTKRPARDSSTSSSASSSNERKSYRPTLSYLNGHPNLLGHENEGSKQRKILRNRDESFGYSVTGTVMRNDRVKPVIFSLFNQNGHSESKRNRLVNPQGVQERTMVYSKLLEDSGLKPNEFSVYCDQCNEFHPAHNGEPQKILFVTENSELFNGARSHSGALEDPSFRELLKTKGICPSQTVHIEFIDVRDGGAFGENLTWLTALIDRESMCRCFVFWNVGTSFLLSGGSVEELVAKNLIIEKRVTSLKCRIRHTDVDLGHKFILVPLVYTRETMDLEFKVMGEEEQHTGKLPVSGHSFNNIMAYNSRVKNLVQQTYPNWEGYLGDPNLLLAVECVRSNATAYGQTYTATRYRFRTGNNPHNARLMNDRAKQGYFVSLIRWVKDTYEQETKDEMAIKRVPQISVNLKLVKRYTKHSQIYL
jgi:hypothetical protein